MVYSGFPPTCNGSEIHLQSQIDAWILLNVPKQAAKKAQHFTRHHQAPAITPTGYFQLFFTGDSKVEIG